MDFGNYIISKALILIPALYVLGMLLKNTPNIKNWLIPWVLTFFGIIGGVFLIGFNSDGVIQGILVAGTTVLGNQLIKQTQNK